MTPIHGKVRDAKNFVQSRPREFITQDFLGLRIEAVAGFNREKALALVDQKRRTANVGVFAGHAFHRERVELASRVLDLGCTPAQQPQPPCPIHFPGVARSVPDFTCGGELGFFIAVSVKIAFHDMIAGHDDFPNLFRRLFQGFELGQSQGAGHDGWWIPPPDETFPFATTPRRRSVPLRPKFGRQNPEPGIRPR